MGLDQFFRFLYPLTDTHGYIKAHNFFGLLLDLAADFFGFGCEIATPCFLKKNSYTVITLLVGDSGFFPRNDLITDIEKNECHQCTFLSFLCIELVHAGIKINIKECHAVTCCGDINSHLRKSLDSFVDIGSAVDKCFHIFGADDLFIFAIFFGILSQFIHLAFFAALLIYFLFHFLDHAGKFHGCYRFEKVFAHAVLDGLFRIFKLSETTEDHNNDIRIIVMQEMAQLHTIHIWHEDISQYDVYRMFLYKFSCLFTVLAVAYEFTVDGFPVDVFFDGIPDENLVIHQ